MAAIYDRFMRGMEEACGAAWRRELLADVHGDVLEIGAGTGRNLEHYGAGVRRLVLTEPDRHMRRHLEARLAASPFAARAEIRTDDAAEVDAPSATFDAVVTTLVLCSVEDPDAALGEARRLLRPGGKLVFLEHVVAPEPSRAAWQRRVEPLWKLVAGNCHLCRDTAGAIARAGFSFERIERESARKALPIVRATIRGGVAISGPSSA